MNAYLYPRDTRVFNLVMGWMAEGQSRFGHSMIMSELSGDGDTSTLCIVAKLFAPGHFWADALMR